MRHYLLKYMRHYFFNDVVCTRRVLNCRTASHTIEHQILQTMDVIHGQSERHIHVLYNILLYIRFDYEPHQLS